MDEIYQLILCIIFITTCLMLMKLGTSTLTKAILKQTHHDNFPKMSNIKLEILRHTNSFLSFEGEPHVFTCITKFGLT